MARLSVSFRAKKRKLIAIRHFAESFIALPRHTDTPRLKFPPIRVYWFSAQAIEAGVEEHVIDDVELWSNVVDSV